MTESMGQGPKPKRYLWCEMNESSASAHGHTDACYTEATTVEQNPEAIHDRLSSGPHQPGNCRFCDEQMTSIRETLHEVAQELRKKYQPVEGVPGQSMGQLGFDYGYGQGIAELEIRLSIAFDRLDRNAK